MIYTPINKFENDEISALFGKSMMGRNSQRVKQACSFIRKFRVSTVFPRIVSVETILF